MTELLENSDNTNERAVVSESPANEAAISLAAVQALADALQKIEAYTPTVWVDNESPDIDAAHLNKAEQAIMRVTTAMNSAVDVIKDLQSQVNTTNNNLSKYFSLYGGTEIPLNSDMHNYTVPGNYYYSVTATVNTLSNCPMKKAFCLKVTAPIGNKTGTYILQEYTSYEGDSIVKILYDPYSKKWSSPVTYVTKDDLSSFLDVVTTEYTVTLSANQSKDTFGSVTIKNGYTPLPKMLSVRIAGAIAIRTTGDNYYADGKIHVYLENTTATERTIKVVASMLCYKS